MRWILLFGLFGLVAAQSSTPTTTDAKPPMSEYDSLLCAIKPYLGYPYVWGSSGLKSFDCSGFVWRVMYTRGIYLKRTTARKFYVCLPKVDEKDTWNAGNLVFFDNMKHCGIVNGPLTFYHSQLSLGTNLSEFDPFWRPKICGFRKMPKPGETAKQ